MVARFWLQLWLIFHRKPGFAFGAVEKPKGGVSLEFARVHLDRAMVALPADYWCVGRRRGYCQPKYRCIELLLQPTYDRHPRNEGNTPWAVIRLILLPFFLKVLMFYRTILSF